MNMSPDNNLEDASKKGVFKAKHELRQHSPGLEAPTGSNWGSVPSEGAHKGKKKRKVGEDFEGFASPRHDTLDSQRKTRVKTAIDADSEGREVTHTLFGKPPTVQLEDGEQNHTDSLVESSGDSALKSGSGYASNKTGGSDGMLMEDSDDGDTTSQSDKPDIGDWLSTLQLSDEASAHTGS